MLPLLILVLAPRPSSFLPISSNLSTSTPITTSQDDSKSAREKPERTKYIFDSLKVDINDYFSRLSLVDLTDQGLLLSMPNKNILRNINLTAPYSQATVANLMLVGAAGYLLSYLPKDVFRNLIAPLETAQANLIRNRDDILEDWTPIISNDVMADHDDINDPYEDYLEPSASFIHPFAVQRSEKKRRKDMKRNEVGFFENIGNQIKSFFWTDEAEEKSIKKDLSGDMKAGREPRYEVMRYEAYEGYDDYTGDAAMEKLSEDEEEEDIGILKKIEKAVAGLFLDNPLARASDESSIGGLVTTVTDFWTDNFSWDYGRFSPKNILVPTDEKVQRDEEKLLEKNAAIDEDVDESLYDEIFNNVDYEDHFKHMQMETDSSQKSEVLTPRIALMSDSLSPPAPPPLQLL